MNNTNSLLHIYYNGFSVGAEVNYIALIVTIFIVGLIFFVFHNRHHFMADSIDLTLNTRILNCTYHVERNYDNLEIAHRIYAELVTRKAAIPIDPDQDVIKEIYDSWYALFKITREEIKTLSGKSLKDDNSDELVEMSIDILNKGLRPHLTAYQAKFRKWYAEELEKEDNLGKCPQEIQKEYPEYDELIKSMKDVNDLLVQYSEKLNTFIRTTK